ncbi:MAG: hypothetical protein FWE35_14055 [Streptosporangiales bacterium]|nr:hypothetical protein [Streptosporangiales bacterium]
MPETVPCPRHQTGEDVRPVSVVYADVFAGDEADLLSPRPVLKTADRIAWTGTGFGVAGMALAWSGTAAGGGTGTVLFWCGIVCFAYALAMYGWAAARRARLTRVQRGAPAALALWRDAWYCQRCDGVFFSPRTGSDAPDGLLSVSEFRHRVWSAGGYGDLLGAAPTGHGIPG